MLPRVSNQCDLNCNAILEQKAFQKVSREALTPYPNLSSRTSLLSPTPQLQMKEGWSNGHMPQEKMIKS
jgi:hypothetical protein